MSDPVWELSQESFVAIWNAAASLEEVAMRVREVTGGPVPVWAVLLRGTALRDGGMALKPLTSRLVAA